MATNDCRAFIFGYNTFDLRFAPNDVGLMQNALTTHGYQIFTPPLVSSSERKTALISSLDIFLDSCGASDTVVVYFSGHAFAPKGKLLLLLDDNIKNSSSTIEISYLTSCVGSCNSSNKLLVLDCCHALSEISDWRPPTSEAYRILSASGRLERAKEIAEYQASFLTYQLHKALTDCYFDVVQSGSELTVNKLYEWIKLQTKKYNGTNKKTVPIPKLMGDQGHDFTISSSRDNNLPTHLWIYLNQVSNCLSGCTKTCFGRYPWCRAVSEIDNHMLFYVIPMIKHSADSLNLSMQRLDEYIGDWLNDKREIHLAILGDSGLGKSSACLFLASKLATECLQDSGNGRVPILLSLESLARNGLLGADIATILRNELKINLDDNAIDTLVKDKRFVFFLDGFDEISDRANHSRILNNLKNLNPVLFSGCKTILTCRTHFFVNQEQIDEILIGMTVGTELYETLKQNDLKFRIVELQEFSEIEITELIKKWHSADSERIWETIKKLYNLKDLSKRPMLLILILETLPVLIKHQSIINRASIYNAYIDFWLKREAGRIEIDVDVKEKEKFIEDMAFEMWEKNIGSITYEELKEEIRNKFVDQIASSIDFYVRDYDTRNASFLNRDSNGLYKFMHRSFMEYFVAKKCIRVLRRDGRGMESWGLRWFEKEVAGFINELLQQKRNAHKIESLVVLCLSSEEKTILWNALHIISLIPEDLFHVSIGKQTLDKIIQRAERESGAVILRQYCRIIAKFSTRQIAEDLIRRIIGIVSRDSDQNVDNNNTYLNYYYGKASACEALLNHLSAEIPKYDRELHIYVLGEVGDVEHVERLISLTKSWKNKNHIQLADDSINKIKKRQQQGANSVPKK